MGALYAYSLLPVLAVALLLGLTAALRGRNARGLAAYCFANAAWCVALLMMYVQPTALIGQRFVIVGSFTAAGYLHAAYEITGQRDFRLVWFAYAVAAAITALGALFPGVVHDPLTLQKGALFWPTMAVAIVAAVVPLWHLARSYRGAPAERRPQLRTLFVAGTLGYAGGMSNATLLAHGRPVPYGLFLSLASLLVLGNVVRAHEKPEDRRLLDRSLLYAALTALLSAAFLFGVLALMSGASPESPLLTQYRVGAFLLFFMAALAFEPLRQAIQESLGRRFIKGRAPASDLARELLVQEARADQSARLAELGAFASAVAHEVRNPLGVLQAHLVLLERGGAARETLDPMREQIERVSRFVDDLLRYGRPRPLELRMVDLAATADLALGAARQALGPAAPAVEILRDHAEGAPLVEADQEQMTQLCIVLFDNALRAIAGAETKRVRVSTAAAGARLRLVVEDSGPGIPKELLPRLFQPFVTGRKRDSTRAGTGLGLAIARGIVERHGGEIRAGASPTPGLGGARFEIELPRSQPLLAAASSSAPGSAPREEASP